MKIAIACTAPESPDAPPEADGWAVDLAGALASRGEDVVLFRRPGEHPEPREATSPARSRAPGPGRRWLGWLRRPAAPPAAAGADPARATEATPGALGDRAPGHVRFARSLIGPLRSGGFDVLHVGEPRLARQVQRARRLGLLKTRTVLLHRAEGPSAHLERFAYVHHLAASPPEASAWRSTWTAIPRFVDTGAFRPGRGDALRLDLGIPPGAVVVLACSPIRRLRDRVSRLIDECAQLLARDPESPLYLIVAGPRDLETPEMIARARAALKDRVRILADLPRGCLPDLYQAADLFTLGTLKGDMPIAAIEAIATGLPCVLHHHPSLQGVVGPGGVPVDLESPGALASTLAALVQDPARRRQIGQAARDHCLRSFDRDLVLDQVLAYYREVLLDDCLRKRPDKLIQSYSVG